MVVPADLDRQLDDGFFDRNVPFDDEGTCGVKRVWVSAMNHGAGDFDALESAFGDFLGRHEKEGQLTKQWIEMLDFGFLVCESRIRQEEHRALELDGALDRVVEEGLVGTSHAENLSG